MLESLASCQGYFVPNTSCNVETYSVPLVYIIARAELIYVSGGLLPIPFTSRYFLGGSIALVERELRRQEE